jgi:hypothetical protein
MSQGDGAPLASSSWKRALDVDLVMACSSSKSDERDRPKLDAAIVGVSSEGELPKSDMVYSAAGICLAEEGI